MTKCSRCGVDKPAEDFALRSSVAKGLVPRAWCKMCDVPQVQLYSPDTARIRKMRQRYGLTEEQFNDMGVEQKWRCAICRLDIFEKPYIDHNHQTGKVRALLCFHCNLGLGHFKDDLDFLREAVRYLEAHYPYNEVNGGTDGNK